MSISSTGKAAEYLGVAVKTLQRWDREGRLGAERTDKGRRMYSKALRDAFMRRTPKVERSPFAYCRVSSAPQKPDLKNQRRVLEDFCAARGRAAHQLTTDLTRRFETIVIEDLNVSGMAKNHGLAGAVPDCGLHEIRRQLQYKQPMRGGRIVIANRFFPSTQACSCCGCLTGPKGREGLGRENWVCSECSAAHTRDGNAAINLRKLGLAEAEVTRGAGKALRQRRRVGRRRSARRPFTPDGTYDDYFFGPSTGREAIKRLLAQFGDGGRNFRWELYDPVRCGSIGYASYRFSYGSTRAEAAGARVVFDGIGR